MNVASLIIGALTGLAGYFLGYWQGKIAQKALDLSITKATPKIGATVKIDKRQENPPAFPAFYYLVATIYNEGELPAKQLKGECKLFSPTNVIQQRVIPISRDFLGSVPYELEGQRFDRGNDGVPIDIEAVTPGNRFNFDIEFEYFGIPDDEPRHYSAKYEYNHQTRQMKKID